jgi:TonB family protein
MIARTGVQVFLALGIMAPVLCEDGQAQTQPVAVEALRPTSQWKVEYAERECRLTRNFGADQDLILFRLARGTSLTNYDIMLAGISIPKQSKGVDIDITISPQNFTQSFNGENRDIPNRKERILRWYDGDLVPILAGPRNQELIVTSDKKYNVKLKMDDFPTALKAMETCHDDLLKGWGIDGPQMRALASMPEPKASPGTWASTKDYPSDLIRAEIGGEVSFKLDVSAEGLPTSCLVIVSSKNDKLDKVTCKIMMQRAKFKPALTADGSPEASHYISRVRWQVPY